MSRESGSLRTRTVGWVTRVRAIARGVGKLMEMTWSEGRREQRTHARVGSRPLYRQRAGKVNLWVGCAGGVAWPRANRPRARASSRRLDIARAMGRAGLGILRQKSNTGGCPRSAKGRVAMEGVGASWGSGTPKARGKSRMRVSVRAQ